MHCSIEAYNDFHDVFMNEPFIIFYALLTSITVESLFIYLYLFLSV